MNEYQLYPEIKPFNEGFLQVSEIHEIRYAMYGNPGGTALFFLHGGPGGGSTDEDARWFDPEKYLIVIHDQRGSGKSTPFAEIKDNTSQALVADIEQLRAHLDISTPVSIFAGSWGSTLALLYAEAFPQNVSRMILRGAFTCTWEAQDYFYSEKGAAIFSPRAWDRLIKTIPPGPGRIQEKIHRLIEEADETGKRKLCKILAEYEYSFFNIVGEELEKLLSGFETYFSEMRINMHYQANRFFLEDQQILKNAGKIAAIPVTLIHGSRDVVCPPAFAWELHRRLPNSQFILVADAGHLSSHPQIRTALLQALSRWE